MNDSTQSYAHLWLTRQDLQNTRRKQPPPSNFTKRDDPRQHGRKLAQTLSSTLTTAKSQHRSRPGTFILRLNYSGFLSLDKLTKHGVELISEEGAQVCVVFADEAGLAKFSDHLQKLGMEDADLTYAQLLEAIESLGSWTREDRQSWAIERLGLPDADTFLLDVELWPLQVTNHPDRQNLRAAFEAWLIKENIQLKDTVNLDSLLVYRLEVSHVQAEMLLDHIDVRRVDLLPETGITYKQLNRDINSLPDRIPHPPNDAARLCVLDTGINTNHPLLGPAVGEVCRFIDPDEISGDSGMDDHGHGTMVGGIALYGDLEACNASNLWQPELWLLGGKVLDRNAEYDLNTIENTLAEAIYYFVEQHNCRIFNLSLGNANAPYQGSHVQGIAYLLDTLARKLDVLFVVSTGNFDGSDDPEVPQNSWREEYPEYLLAEQSQIIDPAPALNVLSVGSVVRHDATHQAQRYPEITDLAPANKHQR